MLGATGAEEEEKLVLIKESETGGCGFERDLKGKTGKGHCRPGNITIRDAGKLTERCPEQKHMEQVRS